MGAVPRRLRAYASHLGLLAVLSLAAALLVTGFPRAANEFTDQGLREEAAGLPLVARDLIFKAGPATALELPPDIAETRANLLPAPLPALVRDHWFAAKVGPDDVRPDGSPPYAGNCRPEVQVRYQSGYESALRLVSGRLPRPGTGTEVLVSADATEIGQLRAGSTLRLGGGTGSAPVTVVGVFEPLQPSSPYWDGLATAPLACPDPREATTVRITLLTDTSGVARAGRATGVLDYEWRYTLATERFRAADLTSIIAAVSAARRAAPAAETSLATSLDSALAGFEQRLRGVRALLAVVRAGLLATMAGLIVLAARVMTDRRREEFALLRARGAASRTVAGRTLRETAVVVPAGFLAGWALGQLVPGRPDPGDGALLVLLGSVALLAAPLLAAARPGWRMSAARRLTAELFVVLLAVLGVVLARRRGLTAADRVDVYLVSVPVLLGAAAALLAVRLLPWPLRQFGRVAARARDAVPFLGLARAGRVALHAGPLAVLVVAIATGVFIAAVSGTVDDARDRATDQETAADARVDGYAFAPGTGRALAAVPGVTGVAPLVLEPGAALTGESGRRTQAQLLVVDGPEAAKVMTAGLPPVLTAPAAGGPAPAVVSPEVAAEVGAGGTVEVQGRRYEFRVAAVAEALPTLRIGARRFIALPWQALPVPAFQPLVPSRFLVAGDGFSPEALRTAGDDGQREYLGGVLGHPVTAAALPERATVTTWDEHRAALARGGVNGVLGFTYTAGAAGTALLALLAIALTVLADAPGRGRTLSRLRTMGLSLRQGRRLLVYEVVPLVTVAFATGGLVGVLLPRLLGPALGLAGFSAGVAGRVRVDAWLPGAALLLLAAAVGVAIAVESAANRRMRLGEVLRLGAGN
ncbi:FtsX-like permease family protein [Actinoplanes aureus]|uniref:ABC transporter permease n=1 Tax=Actinoplanes aureus TaxID=2792083 RepID=A0A931C711_9ACTN|nr:FtsX-like permease family protein [Actinoplanes aureus]MBG0564609.1 ABC transporter permease [Actinoplanes aureus]